MSRSTRAPLSPIQIAQAALAVAGRDGVDQVTARRVASHLGVSPMAMYRHFSSKDELLARTLDAFIGQADVLPDDQLDWDAWLTELGRRMYTALSAEPGWIPWLGTLGVGPEAARVTEAAIERLCKAGMTPGRAVAAYLSMVQCVIGAVCLEASLTGAGSDPERDSGISPLTRSLLKDPALHRLKIAPELEAAARRPQIELALPLLIRGLHEQLAADRADAGEEKPAGAGS